MESTINFKALLDLYKLEPGSKGDSVARSQIEHRISIVQSWRIPTGSQVLEIGPGQGDCTVVLAAAVGPSGHVTAVDPADLDYGSPWTLGQAQSFISASSLGSRITFVQADPLGHLKAHPVTYDYIVFFHSIWYFDGPSMLPSLLQLLRQDEHFAKTKILIAEWALSASLPQQVPHVLGALALASLAAEKTKSTDNIRTAVSPAWIKAQAGQAGWKVTGDRTMVPVEGLLDASWEVKTVLSGGFVEEVGEVCAQMEKKKVALLGMKDAVEAAVKNLKGKNEDVRSMDVWVGAFVAKGSEEAFVALT